MTCDPVDMVLIRDKVNGRCTYCGDLLFQRCDGEHHGSACWEVDHWVPASLCDEEEHPEDFSNLWPCCCACARRKGRRRGEDYVWDRLENAESVPQRTVKVAAMRRILRERLVTLPPGPRRSLTGSL